MIDDYIPWYIGWANCDEKAGDILRQHYQIPFFIPEDSAPGKKDWIFMGTPGFGAPFHLDNVNYPSWQAQVPMRPICFKSLIFQNSQITDQVRNIHICLMINFNL